MSLGPAVLPLTTRGHHLPSSQTQFYRFHSPFTHYYILSYSPLLQTKYSHSVWLINFSSLLLVDASTVVAVIVSHFCSCLEHSFWCFLDSVCLPFCLLNLVSPAFGPRPFFFNGAPLLRHDNSIANRHCHLSWPLVVVWITSFKLVYNNLPKCLTSTITYSSSLPSPSLLLSSLVLNNLFYYYNLILSCTHITIINTFWTKYRFVSPSSKDLTKMNLKLMHKVYYAVC